MNRNRSTTLLFVVTLTALSGAIARAVALYREPKIWAQMQRMGMKMDVSWEKSAARYAALYRRLLG